MSGVESHTPNLADYINARLDELAFAALQAKGPRDGRWVVYDGEIWDLASPLDDPDRCERHDGPNLCDFDVPILEAEDLTLRRAANSGSILAHVAHWDPDAVLADIARKRAILDLHRPETDPPLSLIDYTYCSAGEMTAITADDGLPGSIGPVKWPCPTVAVLAQGYANRADYHPSWPRHTPGAVAHRVELAQALADAQAEIRRLHGIHDDPE